MTIVNLRGCPSDMRRVLQEALGRGWEARVAGSGHFKLRWPPGGNQIIVSHTSGSYNRAARNAAAQLAGVERAFPRQVP
ncbi:MAG: hypothetical protein ACOYD1_07625 [Candidatus Nanopelagicales bacterium]